MPDPRFEEKLKAMPWPELVVERDHWKSRVDGGDLGLGRGMDMQLLAQVEAEINRRPQCVPLLLREMAAYLETMARRLERVIENRGDHGDRAQS
jgi:hypothetical protein